jgi:hypothetical protein
MIEANEVRRRLGDAIQKFRACDLYLLENDLREECISARIAFYLQSCFCDYVVDVEYNKFGESAKRLSLPEQCVKKRDAEGRALVMPDIIIHRRGVEGPNLLVIEVKKTSNPLGFDCDRIRIRAFREQLGYYFGALIECETRPGREPHISLKEWLE